MTEPNKADTADARQASMSRVVTQETLLASMATEQATSEPSTEKVESEQQTEGEKPKGKTPQERIQELANKRREAEAKAEAAERKNQELEARLAALETARNAPVEAAAKPSREQFVSDDEYIEALADWKAEQAVIKREQQQREAQLRADAEAIDNAFVARIKKATAEIEDFEEVVSASNVNIPDFMVMAIKESDNGPLLTYYLAKHQDEARRIAAMRPIQALKQLMQIERDLSEDEPNPPAVSQPKTKPRAPEPISPVRGTTTPNPAPAKNFDEYRARRKAEQRG